MAKMDDGRMERLEKCAVISLLDGLRAFGKIEGIMGYEPMVYHDNDDGLIHFEIVVDGDEDERQATFRARIEASVTWAEVES
jgi:hypothetical protein